jgi:hypothetical protein
MRWLVAAVAIAGCAHAGQQTGSVPLVPLDQGSGEEAGSDATTGSGSAVVAVPEPTKPVEPPKPPPKVAHDTALPATQSTVKLVSSGTGKRTKLAVVGTAGAKQVVDVAIDFGASQGSDLDQTLPAVVLHGDLQVGSADKEATAYTLTVAQVDALDVPGETRPAGFEKIVGGLAGLVITGRVAANGTPGAVAMHHDAADPNAIGILEAVVAPGYLSPWPVLPAEAVGPGAKWRVTIPRKFRDKLVYEETTEYELVSATEIKGTVKLAGPEQDLDGAKVTAVGGSGSFHCTLQNGFIGAAHADVKLGFTASATQGGKTETVALQFRLSSDVTPR